MREGSEIPEFRPTDGWWADWPYGVWTSVQVLASVSGPAAARAAERFLAPLRHDPDAPAEEGASVHYWGGYTAEVTPSADGGAWQIVLSSAGEDGFDSLMGAAEDLAAALRATPGQVQLAWHELAASRAGQVRG